MSEEEKKAAEETAKVLEDIKSDASRNQANIHRNNELLGELKKTLEGDEYQRTSEWKVKFDKMAADLGAIDETIKKLAVQKSADQMAGGEDSKRIEADIFFKNMRVVGLHEFGSNRASDFQLTAAEAEIVQKSHRGQGEIKAAGWDTEQKAAMQAQVMNRSGALIAMPQMLLEIIDQNVREFSPMRQVARLIPTASNQVEIPAQLSHGVSYWSGEKTTREIDENIDYGPIKIPAHEMNVIFQVTQQMLEDSAFDMQGQMTTDYADSQLVLEGSAHAYGNGTRKPQGFLLSPDLVTYSQGEADALTDENAILQMTYQLKQRYMRSPSWQMRRVTMGTIASFTGGDGHPKRIIERTPGTRDHTIEGYPVLANPDMPLVGAGLKPIAFGDWKQGYAIVDKVVSVSMIIDQYSKKENGIIEYLMRKRVGGQTINPEALIVLVIQV